MIFLFFSIVLLISSVWITTPDVSWLKDHNPEETAIMRLNQHAGKQQGQGYYWKFVPLSKISKDLALAVIMSEDLTFFAHHGFDWDAIKYSAGVWLGKRKIISGGSTITQQLAKNLFLGQEKTLIRKVREAVITLKLECNLGKKRILELYLNIIEWGDGIYGVEAASRKYFHKSAEELTVPECIRLASILRNPRKYAPDTDFEEIKKKQAVIAWDMFLSGTIKENEYKKVIEELNLPDLDSMRKGEKMKI